MPLCHSNFGGFAPIPNARLSSPDLVLLWTRAAAKCSYPDCRKPVVPPGAVRDSKTLIGEAAHIVARVPGGPRGEHEISPEERDRYENRILLCTHHHAMIDARPELYTVEVVRAWKTQHESWVESMTASAPAPAPWTAILHEATLDPDAEFAGSIELRDRFSPDGFRADLSVVPAARRRYAVFSLGSIPSAVQLGYILTDRVPATPHQYDRDRATWDWPDVTTQPSATWRLRETGQGILDEAAIRVSLSARVLPDPDRRCGIEIDIEVPDPNVRWLRSPDQLTELARIYAESLDALRRHPCRRIHLFYAGPTAGAIAFGRAYNPRMNPPLAVYDYSRNAYPRYTHTLTLNER